MQSTSSPEATVSSNGPLRVRVKLHRQGHRDGGGRAAPFELDVELEAPPGITILFGRSGSGKSTILQAIAGLVRPDAGRIALGEEVWFDGSTRTDRPVHTRHVAYVFQSLALFPHLTALGNVGYGMPKGMSRSERNDRAGALLERVGVRHLARRKPPTYSGGEAQRVALARALAMSPRVVLLDEPFSALDRELRIQLAGLVRELVDEYHLPLLQVTHNHGEARALGDWVIRLDDGKVVERGGVAEILGETRRSPAQPRMDDIGRTPMPQLRRR